MTAARAEMVAAIPQLRRYARALAGEAEAADDLVQSVLARALERLHQWRPGSDMRAWLFAIMHNLHANRVRAAAARPRLVPIEALAREPAVAPSQEISAEARRVVAALPLLPEDQRAAVLLVGLAGLAYAEAAAVLEIPVGTLMSRLHRGRERLRILTGMARDRSRGRR